jgi:hypothetical protein
MLYMCHVTASIKKLLVCLSISGHPSVSLMEHPFLYLRCNSHLFLCDGITICLSVTTVICISVTVYLFLCDNNLLPFYNRTFTYLSAAEHPSVCLWQDIYIFVCKRTSFCFSVIQHPLACANQNIPCFTEPFIQCVRF